MAWHPCQIRGLRTVWLGSGLRRDTSRHRCPACTGRPARQLCRPRLVADTRIDGNSARGPIFEERARTSTAVPTPAPQGPLQSLQQQRRVRTWEVEEHLQGLWRQRLVRTREAEEAVPGLWRQGLLRTRDHQEQMRGL